MKNWSTKINITEQCDIEPAFPHENSFGLFFVNIQKGSYVYFKPLNELFPAVLFEANQGLYLCFEREFIEEDDKEYALDILKMFNLASKKRLFISKDEFISIQAVIELLSKEYHDKRNGYLIIKSLLKVLMLQLIRLQNTVYLEQDLDQKRVFSFLKLMESHYLDKTSGLFYAQEIGISEKRLNQILKKKLNRTAKQIIQQRQTTEIKRMIKQEDMTLKEMAFFFGFESLSSFSRFFKNHTGLSPTAFKKKL
ncbi:helix-turn-helix domain-containing protein [uncultured Kriegella sp.]|uniref:AraC family transcriptional regulator n=1 Tax=uncultured Kriegella sp. TaxID=1798910 RepID=UPI0030DDAA1B|tara:strand:+ start:112674 stop:113429 length:756 start_codon:yes stop_codon:yes gene_type:complete